MRPMESIARDAARAMAERLGPTRVVLGGKRRWHHITVSYDPGAEAAAIRALVDGVKRRRFKRFQRMPTAWAANDQFVVTTNAVSVRACHQYSIARDKTYFRLDLIGARA